MRTTLIFISLLLHLSIFSQPKPDSVEVMSSVEEQAEYPGGASAFFMFLSKNFEVSRIELNEDDRGCVKFYLTFVILEDGTTSRINMIKKGKNCESCTQEAIRVLSLMKPWKPAMKDGKPVKCFYTCPMRIRIM